MSNKNQSYTRTIIKRELRIDDTKKDSKDFKEVENYLRTVSMKFMKEPQALSIENLDQAYTDIVGSNNTREKTEKVISENRSRSKKHEEKSIFYDIFIKPKENKIKEIRMKRNEQKGIIENDVGDSLMVQEKPKLFISNKTNEIEKHDKNNGNSHKSNIKNTIIHSSHNTPKSMNKDANIIPKNKHSSEYGVETIKINLIQYFKDLSEERAVILYNYLHNKFIPKDALSDAKKNFFNQLIQIRPPEGINATAASPLIDSNKGWAPSIPSLQVSKMKTNLNDLLMRAKGGIQAGDIPKEAHMAFYLGIMNEEEKKYEEALKFYKKFFLSAKLLQDVYGTELALNRIAVLYSNIIDYNQSLYYNEKHKDITTHNVNGFVAFYNCGVCQRILGKIDDSLKSFTRALQMAEEENDLESYTLSLCQLAISFLFIGNMNSYFEHAEEFFNKNKTLRHSEMELEMSLINGYIHNFCGNLDNAKESYMHSLKQSSTMSIEYYKALSLCNIGVIEGSKDLDEFIESLN